MSKDDLLRTRRSLEIIQALQERDGGILATRLDDAYPFTYPRDASFMAMALNMHGLSQRSKAFFEFMARADRPGGECFQRYNRGLPFVSQRGEADVTPIVIHGVLDTFVSSADRRFLERMWKMVSQGVGFVLSGIDGETGLVHTTRSVHEFQGLEEGYEIWANSASARGLVDASRIAAELDHADAAESWAAGARSLWAAISEKLFDKDQGLFIKNLRRDGTRVTAPDVAQLSPFYFGLSEDSESLLKTLEHVRKNLWNEKVGGVNRFRDFELVSDWHWYTGGTDASWPLFTLWMARLYRQQGISESAQECLDFVGRASTDATEIPEKVAPRVGFEAWRMRETQYSDRVINGIARAEKSRTGIPGYLPWACPLGWSHAEYLMAGRLPDRAAERLLGEGILKVP
jgi:glucoamylase